jgi:hypothetical protein
MKNLKNKLIIIAGLLVFTIGVHAQKTFMLQYGFQKGKTYLFQNETSMKQTMTMMGQEQKSNAEGNVKTKWVIDNVSKDGNMTIISNVTEAKVKNSLPKDSAEIKDKERVKITVDKFGKKLNSILIDSIKTQGNNALTGNLNDILKLPLLPGKKVKIGEKWTNNTTDTTNSNGLSIVMKSEREFYLVQLEKKNDHNCLKITYSGKLTLSGKGNQGAMELLFEGTGKMNGTLYFDPKLSIIVSDESNVEMEATIAISGQQSMTIPLSQSTKSSTTLIEK